MADKELITDLDPVETAAGKERKGIAPARSRLDKAQPVAAMAVP